MVKTLVVVFCYGLSPSSICLPPGEGDPVTTEVWQECKDLREYANDLIFQGHLEGYAVEGIRAECVYQNEIGVYQRKDAVGQ